MENDFFDFQKKLKICVSKFCQSARVANRIENEILFIVIFPTISLTKTCLPIEENKVNFSNLFRKPLNRSVPKMKNKNLRVCFCRTELSARNRLFENKTSFLDYFFVQLVLCPAVVCLYFFIT